MKDLGTMTCAACGSETPKVAYCQRYCEPCSEARDLERKRVWANKNTRNLTDAERVIRRDKRRKSRERRIEGGQARTESVSMAWPADSGAPDLLWIVRVAVPFSYSMSKNALWASAPKGHRFLRRTARAAKDMIAAAVKGAIRERRIAHNRLWLDIFVEKPNHRGDALNVVDLVSDAVQDATGLNDRWFCIRCVNWSVVTNGEQRILIGIGQDSDEDALVCSYCGRIRSLDSFTKNRSGPLGRARTCVDCSRISDRMRKPRHKKARPLAASRAEGAGA